MVEDQGATLCQGLSAISALAKTPGLHCLSIRGGQAEWDPPCPSAQLESDLAALGLPPITDRQRAEWGLPQLPGLVDSRRGSGSSSGGSRSSPTPPPLPSMPFFELGGKGRPRQPQGPSRKSSANWSGEDQSFLGMPPFSGISPSQRNILLPNSGTPSDSPFDNLPSLNRSSTSTSGMGGQRRRGSIGGVEDLAGRSGSGHSSAHGVGPATPLNIPRGFAHDAQPWSGYGDLPPLSGLPPWDSSSQSGRGTPKRRESQRDFSISSTLSDVRHVSPFLQDENDGAAFHHAHCLFHIPLFRITVVVYPNHSIS